MADAKRIAKRYRELTGKPLGITGEVGEYEAARVLGLQLADARQAGYDAVAVGKSGVIRYEVKTRCVLEDSTPGQRMGRLKLDKEWDAVLLVLLDENLEPTEILEAARAPVQEALMAPGSRARNERGALGVAKFRKIARVVWRREPAA
jgi:hypothetical protein